jgi:hypothetical protein
MGFGPSRQDLVPLVKITNEGIAGMPSSLWAQVGLDARRSPNQSQASKGQTPATSRPELGSSGVLAGPAVPLELPLFGENDEKPGCHPRA